MTLGQALLPAPRAARPPRGRARRCVALAGMTVAAAALAGVAYGAWWGLDDAARARPRRAGRRRSAAALAAGAAVYAPLVLACASPRPQQIRAAASPDGCARRGERQPLDATCGDVQVSSARPAPILVPEMAPDAREAVARRRADVGAACRAAVAELAAVEGLLPSVYLARGGRLRCQARPRLPADPRRHAADRGRHRPGLLAAARDPRPGRARRSADYLEALPGVAAELAVPVRCGRPVVGVLNVESRAPLSDDARERDPRLRRRPGRAHRRARRPAGGVRGPAPAATSPASPPSRTSPRSSAQLLRAALDLVELDSAMLAARRRGRPLAREVRDGAAGRRPARRAAGRALRTIAEWVCRAARSCFTVGAAGRRGPPRRWRPLRAGGVGALAALTLAVPDGRGDARARRSPTGGRSATDRRRAARAARRARGELLRTAEALARRCASAPPPTRSPASATTPPSTRRWPPRTAARARPSSSATSTASRTLNDTFGHQHGDRVLRRRRRRAGARAAPRRRLFRIGGDEFAALLRGRRRRRGARGRRPPARGRRRPPASA